MRKEYDFSKSKKNPYKRIVIRCPLNELWNDSGPFSAIRLRDLSSADIQEMIHNGLVRFVVADVGHPLRWISVADCYTFWKSEVRSHIALPNQQVFLEEFPGSYCYFASKWSEEGTTPIVLLERCH